jgi:hypothetical protein
MGRMGPFWRPRFNFRSVGDRKLHNIWNAV